MTAKRGTYTITRNVSHFKRHDATHPLPLHVYSDVNDFDSIPTESSDSTTDTVEKRDALKSCIRQPDDVRRSSRLRKLLVKFKDFLGLPEAEN